MFELFVPYEEIELVYKVVLLLAVKSCAVMPSDNNWIANQMNFDMNSCVWCVGISPAEQCLMKALAWKLVCGMSVYLKADDYLFVNYPILYIIHRLNSLMKRYSISMARPGRAAESILRYSFSISSYSKSANFHLKRWWMWGWLQFTVWHAILTTAYIYYF